MAKGTRRAFVTGITGQDGSFLAELLLEQGCEVHGLVRRSSTFGAERIDHLYLDPREPNTRLYLHYGDPSDAGALSRLLQEIQPGEVYNLGAQSHVAVSFQQPVYTADVDARGHALPPAQGEYMQAVWLMLQQDQPDDYVVATGERHSVREFCEATFALLDLDWQDLVKIDEAYLRPAEVDVLQGDASKAREGLGWKPTVDFSQLVERMVYADLALARRERTLVDAGHEIVEWRSGRPG